MTSEVTPDTAAVFLKVYSYLLRTENKTLLLVSTDLNCHGDNGKV